MMEKLVIATHNEGKLAEFRHILAPFVKGVVSSVALGLAEPEETGETFEENAALKAGIAAKESGLPALADDSGLCVTALAGRPGLFSARWAGENRDFARAMARVHEELGEAQDRTACFICALALVWPDGKIVRVCGRSDGDIVWPPRGAGGHGYDPIFRPEGETRTFAEMTCAEKDKISHRGRALAQLAALFAHA